MKSNDADRFYINFLVDKVVGSIMIGLSPDRGDFAMSNISLGAVDADEGASSPAGRKGYGRVIVILAVHLAVVAVWQSAVMLLDLPKYILPSPLETLQTLTRPHYSWLLNSLTTATEVFCGYALGVLIGIALALAFSWWKWLAVILLPLFVTLNMIPKVALGPLLIVWFGYGIGANILIAFAICFFPVLLTTARGLSEIEPDLLDLVRSLRGSRWQMFWKIQFPGALPYVFSGMKVGAVLAVAGAIVGEFIGSDSGLGYLMIQVQASLDMAGMLMAMIFLTLIGVALYGAVLALERLVVVGDVRLN